MDDSIRQFCACLALAIRMHTDDYSFEDSRALQRSDSFRLPVLVGGSNKELEEALEQMMASPEFESSIKLVIRFQSKQSDYSKRVGVEFVTKHLKIMYRMVTSLHPEKDYFLVDGESYFYRGKSPGETGHERRAEFSDLLGALEDLRNTDGSPDVSMAVYVKHSDNRGSMTEAVNRASTMGVLLMDVCEELGMRDRSCNKEIDDVVLTATAFYGIMAKDSRYVWIDSTDKYSWWNDRRRKNIKDHPWMKNIDIGSHLPNLSHIQSGGSCMALTAVSSIATAILLVAILR